MKQKKHMVTIAEAAELMGCSRQNIDQLISKHGLKTVTKRIVKRETVSRKVKLRQVDLNELKKAKERT